MDTRFRYLALAVAAAAAFGCESGPTTPTALSGNRRSPSVTLNVQGRVIDYTSNRAVANVALRWSAPGVTETVSTDANGRYNVRLAPREIYGVTLLARPGDVISIGSGSVVVPTVDYETDFYINPGNCVLLYGFAFDAATRNPVSNARVSWIASATTDARGEFRMAPGCGLHRRIGTTAIIIEHSQYPRVLLPFIRGETLPFGGIFRRDFLLTRTSP